MLKVTQIVLVAFLIMFGMLFNIQEVSAQEDYAADQLIIKYKKGGNSAAVKARLAERGVPGGKSIPELGLEVLEVPPGELEAIQEELSQDPDVEYIEKNYYYEPLAIPNDPLFSDQLYFDVFQAPQAWDLETGNPDVVIAVLDTGVDVTHEDLVGGKVVTGCNTIGIDFDHTNCNPDVSDTFGHGTGVAGTAAADTNNNVGVAGVCWGCSLMPIKISTNGNSALVDIIEGIMFARNYAINNPTKRVVINMSFGRVCTGLTQAEFDALNLAWDSGLLAVAARGNSGDFTTLCPAIADNVIAVSGTTLDDFLWSSSSWNNVDLAAPALPIYNIAPGAKIDPPYIPTWGGTSFSSAIVSGVAGLAWSADMTLTNSELDQLLRITADDLGNTAFFGAGRINANAAVDYAINPPPPPTPTPTPAPTPTPLPYTILDVNRPLPNGIIRRGLNTFEGNNLSGITEDLFIIMVGTDPSGSTPIKRGPCAGKVDIGIANASKFARMTITPDQFRIFQTTYRIGGKYVGDSVYIQAYRQSNNNGNDRCFISEVIPVRVF